MTTRTDLTDLAASVERARQELHPHLDAMLLRRVIEIEHRAGDNAETAMKEIEKLMEKAVREEVEKC